jgi:uncharacterized protein YggU (UPF0235/DUF167 family)
MVITVRVHTRASRARTVWSGDRLDVWVTAPPVGGAANAAVLKAVADELDVPASAVTLRAGARARTKLVEVDAARRPR